MTEKLYYTDSYLTEFNATLLEASPLSEDHWAVILDRTAFYPESGGQPYDKGTLNNLPVLDVQLDEFDRVVHITKGLPMGPSIRGKVDWPRRFDHMQQHSGEHILTDAFLKILGAHNIGFHLGVESTQIDLDINALSLEQLTQVEQLANEIIFENRKITIHFPTPEELQNYPLRKAPTVTENVRLIFIEAADCCPCGGTHVRQTGEVGLIKIRSWERKKQGIRIDFVCGQRALRDFQLKNTVINQLSALVSAPPSEVGSAVILRIERQDTLNKELAAVRQELVKYLAHSLSLEATSVYGYSLIVHIVHDPNIRLTDIAKELLQQEKYILLLGQVTSDSTRCNLLFTASPGLPAKMNEVLKSILPLVDGRGGGNALSAQGGGNKPKNLGHALEQAKESLLATLRNQPTP